MSRSDRIFWVLWLVATIVLVWLALPSRGEVPPLPPEPPSPRLKAKGSRLNPLTQGAGARLLLAQEPVVKPRVATFVWRYASAYTNVWFNLEASADLKNWVCIRSNATGDLWVTNAGERFRGFRLKGRFTP